MTASTGNCYYLAPEAFKGDEQTDRSDVFSLAVVMWETLARRKPFCGMAPQKCAFSVAVEGLRLELGDLIAEGHAALAGYMEDMWCQDPAQRPGAKQVVLFLRNLY